jgi:GcrA cell cycle regulator
MRWTDDELRELVALWPTNSAKQIARRLHRPRSAICGKAKRLRAEGVLPDGVHKHFDVVPVKARPRPARSTAKKPAPVLKDTAPHLEIQPCRLLELDNTRCRWPLGEVPGPVLFCGGPTGRGCPYCRIIFGWRRKADCGLRVLKIRYPPDVRRSLSREGVCGGYAAPMPELDGGMRN